MPQPQTKPLEFKDQDGRVRLSIGLDAGGSPQIELFDENGKDRLRLELTKDGAGGLCLKDREGKTYGGLSEHALALGAFRAIPAPGGAAVHLGKVQLAGIDEDFMIGTPRHPVSVFVSAGTVKFLDEETRDRVRFIVDDKNTFLVLCDRDSDRAVAIGINAAENEGQPKVQLFDSRGAGKLTMELKEEEPVIAFFSSSESKTPDMVLGAFGERRTGVVFFDAQGKETGAVQPHRLQLGPAKGPSFSAYVDKVGVVSKLAVPKTDTALVSAVFSDGSRVFGLMNDKTNDMKHGVGVGPGGGVEVFGLEKKKLPGRKRARAK